MFDALAHPPRSSLIEALREGEKNVGERVERVDINQSGVSKHIQLRHDAGFVTVRRDAQRRVYMRQPEAFGEVEF